MTAPPAFEAKVARRLRVDFGVEIVLLGPKCVCRVLIFEILHEPSAIELAGAEIAGERGKPAAAHQATRITHGILAMDALPIRQRRAGDDDRAKQLWPQRREHHDRPARLAVSDHTRFVFGLRMQFQDFFQKYAFGAGDILDRLSRHWLRQEADEIARVTCL